MNPAAATHCTPPPATLQGKVDCVVPSEWRPNYGHLDPESKLMVSVPKGFVPVDAVRCNPAQGHVSGDLRTTSWTIDDEHPSGDYNPLLAALSQPSDGRKGVACTSDGELLPELWLVNAAGQAVHVMWPMDECSNARGKPGTAKALAALTDPSTKTLDAPNSPLTGNSP